LLESAAERVVARALPPAASLARPAISLVLATIGNDARLARLLESLRAQSFKDFETIVVDQSGDDRLVALVAEHRSALRIRHVRHSKGLSRSRNAGLRVARGDVVCFPDDDCWYEADVLDRVHRFLAGAPHIDGVTGRAVFAACERPPARFARRAQWVVQSKVWTQGISCTIFLRRALIARVGYFDEALGLGANTCWIASEESEYLLRAVKQRARIWYDPELTVHHPGHRGRLAASQWRRGAGYARAMGRVLRVHRAGLLVVAYHLARPVGGALLSAGRGRFDVARFHLAVLLGRWRGWRDADTAPTMAHADAQEQMRGCAAGSEES
jgi:glycosyltransferase involved in cell wall biosynthesis